jgi:glycine betaine/choline ABC-type transport system substrate-binding protein
VTRLAALLLAALLAAAGCADNSSSPKPGTAEVVVGSWPDAESKILAEIYVSALRSYGFAARTEAATDPLTKLDSGAFTVVPAFTGKVLRTFQPGAGALSDSEVYRAMISALPEGVAAGDYATAAEDKSALVVTQATAKAWGGSDLSELPAHCDGLVVGVVGGPSRFTPPSAVGSCRLPAPREYPDSPTMLAALRAGELTSAWTRTAAVDAPADLVMLADSGKSALIQAENVVPLYRRNALSTRQLLAVNEVAGVLDTAALSDMRRQVAGGADPQAVAGGWLAEHPLGR